MIQPLQDLQAIPLAGIVAAGKPFELIETDDQLKVPRILLSHGKNIALRVRGDSMVEAGIRDGDIVIAAAHRRERPDSGCPRQRRGDGQAVLPDGNARGTPASQSPAEVDLRGGR